MVVTAGGSAARAADPVDTILTGGRIHTPSGWQQAVAMSGERIIATGDVATIRALARPQTATIELRGATVLPGLYDMHVHPLMAGNGAVGRCRIEQGADAARLLEVVAACVKAEQPGRWVTGAQWQAVSMGSTPINCCRSRAPAAEKPYSS